MNAKRLQNLVFPLLFSTTVFGCAETMNEQEWPDAEFGIESTDGKDDSFAIRPDSREAEAVLAYVNQPLRDQAAGDAFLNAIDDRLDKRAARAIAKYRAGSDGLYGTDDDRIFDTLQTLDAQSYVGRTALMRLFELAVEAGLFNNASIECADYIAPSSRPNYPTTYHFRSYASLLELENSKCEVLRGDVTVQISSTDLLPPAHRMLKTLRHVKTIEGNLTVESTGNMTGAEFDKLESISGNLIVRDSIRSAVHKYTFPSLTNANRIQLFHVGSVTFGALKHSDFVESRMRDITGFKALETVTALEIHGAMGDSQISFPKLVNADTLRIAREDVANWRYLSKFNGAFEKLKSVDKMTVENSNFQDFTFPVLNEVSANLTVKGTMEPMQSFSSLKSVGGNFTVEQNLYIEAHISPAKLERVEGNIKLYENFPVKGYDKLTYAGGSIWINTKGGVVGFGKIEQTFGRIDLTIVPLNQTNLGIDAFHKLTDSRDITMIFGNIAGPRKGFGKLKEIEGSLNIQQNDSDVESIIFTALEAVNGSVTMRRYNSAHDLFPSLQIISGSLGVTITTNLVGFDKLSRVEGGLRLLGNGFNNLPGLKQLRAVGGDIEISQYLDATQRDEFLNQLTEFSGNIFLR